MAEDLFVVYFSHILHVLAHLTFDKSGLNPMHLYLCTTAIFADQDCLLFVTPKNLSIVFFFHLFRSKVLPKKIFLLLGIYTWDSFYTFDLDIFQSPSTFKSFSSSGKFTNEFP